MTSSQITKIFIDGASRSNPGEASCGFVIYQSDGTIMLEGGHYLGVRTNNEAEYCGLIFALRKALELGITKVSIRSDSELLVRQVHGVYKVKKDHLKRYKAEVDALIGRFAHFDMDHVERAANKEADRLANEVLDEALDKGTPAEDVFPAAQDSLF